MLRSTSSRQTHYVIADVCFRIIQNFPTLRLSVSIIIFWYDLSYTWMLGWYLNSKQARCQTSQTKVQQKYFSLFFACIQLHTHIYNLNDNVLQ